MLNMSLINHLGAYLLYAIVCVILYISNFGGVSKDKCGKYISPLIPFVASFVFFIIFECFYWAIFLLTY